MAWFPRMSKVLEGMFPSWFITMTDTQRWVLEATPKALKLDVESSDGEHIPKYIEGEALDHWLAGSSTTPDALSWLLYELSRPENALRQQRLQQELRAASITPESPPHIHDLTKLTYLDCVLRETLRRHPPTHFSLTREAPSGGMTVDGHFVPGGARVSVQSVSLHMDPDVFHEPNDWNPER
ncbi:Cytochrome 84A4 like protein [Verticillium longisporum]|nr:Cytochrome 84A4 like protein [Verticillium longisporum]